MAAEPTREEVVAWLARTGRPPAEAVSHFWPGVDDHRRELLGGRVRKWAHRARHATPAPTDRAPAPAPPKHASPKGRPRGFLRGHNVRKNGSNAVRGAAHYRWKAGERMVSSTGYAKLRVGKTHPLADPNGYAYEHIVVWVAAGNDRPTRSQVLHHINENKLDNRLENLRLLSKSEHNALHIAERRRDATGRLHPRVSEAA